MQSYSIDTDVDSRQNTWLRANKCSIGNHFVIASHESVPVMHGICWNFLLEPLQTATLEAFAEKLGLNFLESFFQFLLRGLGSFGGLPTYVKHGSTRSSHYGVGSLTDCFIMFPLPPN